MARERESGRISPEITEAVLALRKAEVEFVQAYGQWTKEHRPSERAHLERAERRIDAAEREIQRLQARRRDEADPR